MAPNVVEQTALSLLTAKATSVLTNVPGPKEAIYMAGNKVADCMFWVPQSGDIGMGISILSYQGAYPVRPDDRQQSGTGSGSHHQPFPGRIREVAVLDLDGAVGRAV